MAERVRFHLDENVDPRVASALRRHGADATTTVEAGLRAEPDIAQLDFALAEGRVLVTHDADFLRSHLDKEDSATFATDFGVHLAIKPFVKGFEYWVCPLLYALGFLSEGAVALIMLTAGPAARSLYTGGRIVQNSLRGKERPWTALAVGAFPVVGNFAFPIQLLRSSREEEDDLARFLLYDGFARVGARIPIWGGEDTLTEHRLNRLADHIVRR